MSLCSNCSVPVVPIVAIDIDGTMAEYHMLLARHVSNYWDLPIDPTDTWDGEGNYEDWLGITQDQYREAKLAFRQGGFKRWAPEYGGLAYLRQVVEGLRRERRLEVWITTTRPWNRLDSTDPDTRWWLDRKFPVYDHLLYDDHKYPRLAEIVDPSRVVMVLEDLPEMYTEAVETFGVSVPWLVVRPHNYKFSLKCSQSVESLGMASRILVEEVERYHSERK